VLRTVICLFNPLSVEQLQKLLGADMVDVSLVLERLKSVLLVPEDRDKPVQVFHESLRDFLMDSNSFSVDVFAGHSDIAHLSIDLMVAELRIIDDTIEEPKPAIGGALQYGLCYWSGHLARSPTDNSILESLGKFAVKPFFTWLETLRRYNRCFAVLAASGQLAEA
jgi:hypothetical protein